MPKYPTIADDLQSLAMPISALVSDPKNARKHSIRNIDAIKGSLAMFGQRKPIVVNESNGALIVTAGNGTLEAARELGWTHLAVVRTKDDLLTSTGYALADNRSAELAEWDDDGLAAALAGLQDAGWGLDGLGFDDGFVAGVLGASDDTEPDDGPSGDSDEETTAEKLDQLQKQWRTKQGQIWSIPSLTTVGGFHLVMCGDCRKSEDVSMLMRSQKVNVAVTSPPYASQRKYDEESGFKPIKPDEYVDWFEAVQENVRSHLASDGSWFVNIKEHCDDGQRSLYVKDLTIAHVRRWGWRFVDEFCWRDTRNGMPGRFANRFKDAWEPVFHFCQGSSIRFNATAVGQISDQCFDYSPNTKRGTDRNGMKTGTPAGGMKMGIALPSNVLEIAAGSDCVEHSAAFPVALPSFFIKAYSDPGDIIFDPFTGSGTTMIAAEQEGRLFRGLELSPKYLAVILSRASNAGMSPTLVTP